MADYIPAADAQFDAWQAHFMTYVGAHLVDLGLVAGDLTPVTAARTQWATTYPAHVAAQASATSARALKDAARAGYVTLLRALVKRLQASPQVSDDERAAMNITIPDPSTGPIPAPTTRPVVTVECQGRLRHVIGFTDESTPTRRAKPEGALGAEIWHKVDGPPPVDPSELSFVALDTATPYTLEFPGTAGGKQAHYWLRWVTATGLKGPWSLTASATIEA